MIQFDLQGNCYELGIRGDKEMNEEEIIRKNLKELANNIFSKLDVVEKSYLLMVNNEKNKQINELKQELQRKDNEIKQLREDIVNHIKIASEYKEQMIIKDNIINDLKSSIADYQEAVGDYQDELKRKDNIIKFIKQYIDDNCWAYAGIDEDGINILLDKIKELEENGNK